MIRGRHRCAGKVVRCDEQLVASDNEGGTAGYEQSPVPVLKREDVKHEDMKRRSALLMFHVFMFHVSDTGHCSGIHRRCHMSARALSSQLPEQAGRPITLFGWVHRIRNLGGVRFLLLRDREGIAQIVVPSCQL